MAGQLKDDRDFVQTHYLYDDNLDVDELDLSFDDLDGDLLSYDLHDPMPVMDGKMESKLFDQTIVVPEYILGTLIVRVSGARDLKAPRKGNTKRSKNSNSSRRRMFQRHSSSTYAVLGFGDQLEKTSSVDEAINPSWTRSEPSLFFDITLPITNLIPARHEQPPKQMLCVSLFHSDGDASLSKGKSKKHAMKQSNVASDHDEFAGMASIDVTAVLTGKSTCIDKWLPLEGLDDATGSTTGSARIIIEYECAEIEPRVGDKVRFTGFVNAALCPVPRNQIFKVEEVIGDETILSYVTPVERWRCRIKAHRFMLISVERHVTAVERYQEELFELTNNLAHSPAAEVVSETVKSLPEEGLIAVGMQTAFGGITLLQRWAEQGMKVAVDDIVYAANLDGKQTPEEEDESDDDDLSFSDHSISGLDEDDVSVESDANLSVASDMPCCPISGEPMHHPVVAADGHTYDRSSIRKWLKRSNISPLTGTELKNKDLIPNYLLISTFQKGRRVEEESQVSQV